MVVIFRFISSFIFRELMTPEEAKKLRKKLLKKGNVASSVATISIIGCVVLIFVTAFYACVPKDELCTEKRKL